MDEAEKFKYSPLDPDQIRLLKIRPGFEYDEISCKTHHFPIDEAPPYVAISYRWGAATDAKMMIRVDTRPFELLPNAYWALHYQRQIEQQQYVWIDTLSINQSNTKERNEQVALMGVIFAGARETFVWLGLPDTDVVWALELLRGVGSEVESGMLMCDDLEEVTRVPIVLGKLFDLEYWNRIWVVQELLFASKLTLMCGEHRVDWRCLERYLDECDKGPNRSFDVLVKGKDLTTATLLPPSDAIVKLVNGRRTEIAAGRGDNLPANEYNLDQLLQVYKNHECQDRRDKVFALLEIWNRRGRAPFLADYSNSIHDVFMRTYAYILSISDKVAPGPNFCSVLLDTLGVEIPATPCWRTLLSDRNAFSRGLTYPLKNENLLDMPGLPIRSIATIVEVKALRMANETTAKVGKILQLPVAASPEEQAASQVYFGQLMKYKRALGDGQTPEFVWLDTLHEGADDTKDLEAVLCTYRDSDDHYGLVTASAHVGDSVWAVGAGLVYSRLIVREPDTVVWSSMNVATAHQLIGRAFLLEGVDMPRPLGVCLDPLTSFLTILESLGSQLEEAIDDMSSLRTAVRRSWPGLKEIEVT